MNLHSKKDFQDCMLSILEPLKPYYSEEKARLTLGVTMAHYDIALSYPSLLCMDSVTSTLLSILGSS